MERNRLTYRLTSITHRRQNVSKAASHKKCSPAKNRTAFQIRTKMDYSDFLPAALSLAQRAFAAAEILALAAALIVRFLAGALMAGFAALIFAQRAFCAFAILALPAALILPFFGALAGAGVEAPSIEASSLVNASIFSLRSAACLNCVVVNDSRLLIVG